jgi:hypothetical protein
MRIPKLRRHASSVGTARPSRVDHYFGPWPAPPADVERKYRQAVSRCLAAGRKPVPGGPAAPALIGGDLIDRYIGSLREDCPAGSREPVQVELAARPHRDLYGLTPAAEFDASKLALGRADYSENPGLGPVAREQLYGPAQAAVPVGRPAETVPGRRARRPLHAGAATQGLAGGEGAGEARPRDRRRCRVCCRAPDGSDSRHASAALAHRGAAGRGPAAPGDEIDRSGDVRVYRPGTHKGSWKEQDRAVAVGPAARSLLAPWLALAGGDQVFSPRRLVRLYRAAVVRREAGDAADPLAPWALTWFERVPGRTFSRSTDCYPSDGFEASVGAAAARKAGRPWFSAYSCRDGFKMVVAGAMGPDATKAAMGNASIGTQALTAGTQTCDTTRRTPTPKSSFGRSRMTRPCTGSANSPKCPAGRNSTRPGTRWPTRGGLTPPVAAMSRMIHETPAGCRTHTGRCGSASPYEAAQARCRPSSGRLRCG